MKFKGACAGSFFLYIVVLIYFYRVILTPKAEDYSEGEYALRRKCLKARDAR